MKSEESWWIFRHLRIRQHYLGKERGPGYTEELWLGSQAWKDLVSGLGWEQHTILPWPWVLQPGIPLA